MVFETLSFLTLGILATVLAGALATRRWPVSAAMLLISMMVCLAGLYALLDAHFAAVAQIIVYAGAIMVVFIFVIMLLNLPPEELRFGNLTIAECVLAFLGVGAAFALGTKAGQGYLSPLVERANAKGGFFPEADNIKNVAALTFSDYLWSFELISFLILAAVVGSVVISKKRKSHAESA